MTVKSMLGSLFLLILLISCKKQEVAPQKQWYKGNLHTHSYWSDGDEFPEMIMDWYKSNGYHFVGLSDHNVLARQEKWVTIAKNQILENAFEAYRTHFGPDNVVYKQDTGRISVKLKTLEEYRPMFEAPGEFLIIESEEITDGYKDKPVHLNVSNVQSLIKPKGGESVLEVMQNNINAALQQRAETGIPNLVHINHPNFYYAITLEDMQALQGEQFFEVYNGHPLVNNYGDSTHIGTEEMWDQINITYLNRDQPVMYGIATDDSHSYHLFGSEYSNAGRGWVMVHTENLETTSLIKAMETGQFYASTGVQLDEIKYENNLLSIAVSEEPEIQYDIQFIGVRKGNQVPEIIKTVKGPKASHQVEEEWLFVRIKVISDQLKPNPFQVGDVEVAWTQPVMHQ
ncbi:MAG: hypothetical protein DHS20C18_07350 [Saprospiraceae bacterium]|nr:MAG: hypothetical protein DHS20C18_07350 [Saprospiraceae bacterium]